MIGSDRCSPHLKSPRSSPRGFILFSKTFNASDPSSGSQIFSSKSCESQSNRARKIHFADQHLLFAVDDRRRN